jgi:hypothetical protein
MRALGQRVREERGARSHAAHRDSVQLAICACAAVDIKAAKATAAKPVLITFITPYGDQAKRGHLDMRPARS